MSRERASPVRANARFAPKKKRRWFRAMLLSIAALAVAFYAACALVIVAFRWIPPPTTSVQMERRFQAFLARRPYRKQYVFVPLKRIAPALQHAVIAAEDARFYQHHGFDWVEVQKVLDQDLDKGKLACLSQFGGPATRKSLRIS